MSFFSKLSLTSLFERLLWLAHDLELSGASSHRLTNLFERLLWLALCAIPFLSPHILASYVWSAPALPQTNVWEGFRSIALHLVDIPLAVLLIITPMILFWSEAAAAHFFSSVRQITTLHGGFWWGLLLIWAAFSANWASEFRLAMYNTFHLAVEILAALWIADFVRRGYARSLLLAMVLAAVAHSTVAIAQIVNGNSLGLTALGEIQRLEDNPFGFGFQTFRGSGFAVHPNNLGGFLMIALFACLALLFMTRLKNARTFIPLALCFGVIGVGLLATISRAAIIAGALTLPIPILLNSPKGVVRRLVGVGLVVMVVVVAAVILLGGSLTDRLSDRMSGLLVGPEAFTRRLTFAFADTTTVIRESPVLGSGNANLMVEVGELRSGSGELLLPAHSVFWVIWAELGIIGVALFTAANLFALMRLHPANGNSVIWASCILALCLVAVADFYLWGDVRSRTLYLCALGIWWGYTMLESVPPQTAET